MRSTGLSNAVPSKVSPHVLPLLLASQRDELREVRDETPEVGFADQAEALDVVSALPFGFALPVVQAAQESRARSLGICDLPSANQIGSTR